MHIVNIGASPLFTTKNKPKVKICNFMLFKTWFVFGRVKS